jgi:hypothetical protein
VFVVVIFVMLYYDLVFVHKNAIPITNPPPTTSAFVKEVSVNDNMSKNNNNDMHIQSLPTLPSAAVKTHIAKTTTSLQQPSKSNSSNQQVSLPSSNNNNKDYHSYSRTIINSTQNVNSSPISSHPRSSSSSSVKYLSNKNPTIII